MLTFPTNLPKISACQESLICNKNFGSWCTKAAQGTIFMTVALKILYGTLLKNRCQKVSFLGCSDNYKMACDLKKRARW